MDSDRGYLDPQIVECGDRSRHTAAPDPEPSFSAGQVACGRFVIEAFLAAGGMGEVYEARDLELNEWVALKTIRSRIASDPSILDRFLREVQLARQVTHPNVCRVYDLFRHKLPSGEEIVFLTMELLRGESLEIRLIREGHLEPGEALDLLRQMAAALDAAHEAGIIHRDFKPANVVLVPARSGEGNRAVVTDFGLACSQCPQWESPAKPGSLPVVGSPVFMAPEQASGRETTAAADIYSLGLVLYQMLTGVLPHRGDGPLSVLIDRMTVPVLPPSQLVPGIPEHWEPAILRCLELDPKNRFTSAGAFIKALETPAQPSPPQPAPENTSPDGKPAEKRKTWFLGAAGTVLVLSGLLALTYAAARKTGSHPEDVLPAETAVRPAIRRSVAVMGFKNLSGKPEMRWVSTALAEMLTTELSLSESVRLVPGETVSRMQAGISLPQEASYGLETLGRIRTILGNDSVILGSYYALGNGELRLDIRMQDTATAETVVSISESGTESELPALVSRVGSRIRVQLGATKIPAGQSNALRAAFPSTRRAAQAYADGLTHLRAYEALDARDHFLEAVAADPASPLVHSALAEAWSMLGYSQKAKEETKKALELSSGLAREERLLIEARFKKVAGDWPGASETFQTLVALFPDNLDYGLELASATAAAGKSREALRITEKLRDMPGALGEDPRIDLVEAEVFELVPDFEQALSAAERAATEAVSRGMPQILAPARLRQAYALSMLGRRETAQTTFEEARRVFASARDRKGVALTLGESAFFLGQDGHLLEAKRQWEEALATSRETGDRNGEVRALKGLGILYHHHGQLGQSGKYLEEGLAVALETGDAAREYSIRNNLGITLREQGQLESAAAELGRAQRSIEHGDTGLKRYPAYNLGETQLLMGNLSEARKSFDQALSSFRVSGERRGVAYSLFGIGSLLFEQGDLKAARQKHQEALEIWEEIGERWASTPSRIALARIALEKRDYAQAEALAERASDDARDQDARANEAMARSILTTALALQGKQTLAAEVLSRTRRLLREIDHLHASLFSELILAQKSGSDSDIESLRQRVKHSGFVGLALEVRLLIAHSRFNSGQTLKTREELWALEREAVKLGFKRIAGQANHLLRQVP